MHKIMYPQDCPLERIKDIETKRDQNIKHLSEGEEFIKIYLEEKGIEYIQQYPLFLKEDTKKYRLADFYLPQYEVFIEFFGQYNTPKGKERYKEKKDLYRRNGINCIYTYPENLGFFDFLFKRRLLEALKRERKFWPLLRYTWNILIVDSLKWVVLFIIVILYLLFRATNIIDKIGLGVIFLLAIASVVVNIVDTWKKKP